MNTHLQLNDSDLNYYDEKNQLIEFVDDEPVAKSFEDGGKLVDALFEQTDDANRYANTPENLNVLIRVARKLNRHNPRPDALTQSRLLEAYKTANAAGGECGDCGTLEKLPPPVEEAPRARNKAGRFENPLVVEYHRMLEDPSIAASAITERMRTDAAFRAAVESESSRQQPSSAQADVDPEELARLRTFAAAYRREPSLRFLSGYVTIGGQQYTRQEARRNRRSGGQTQTSVKKTSKENHHAINTRSGGRNARCERCSNYEI